MKKTTIILLLIIAISLFLISLFIYMNYVDKKQTFLNSLAPSADVNTIEIKAYDLNTGNYLSYTILDDIEKKLFYEKLLHSFGNLRKIKEDWSAFIPDIIINVTTDKEQYSVNISEVSPSSTVQFIVGNTSRVISIDTTWIDSYLPHVSNNIENFGKDIEN